ncbi:MAG: RsmB/NOP family class I SAM-dependent RNA methyltransferase [Verrucomicrobiota bacterium]|nr:RsmB/NOP family class I SAM-dependent RNA methyltransferase [Verrucomicrobiota bacterium]
MKLFSGDVPSSERLAARIIAKTNREHPADSVLRAELKSQRGLSREEGRKISQAVFAYFRWLGWLDKESPMEPQISIALELDQRFSENPNTFSDEEFLAKVIPDWIKNEMKISPEWIRSLQNEPKLWLRAKRGRGRELAQKLGECWIPEPPLFADTLLYEGSEDLFSTPEFHAGDFELQDINSQIVGLICDPKPGETWWDACAGEGGKLIHLSDLMQNKGLIWASDRADWRLKKLKRRTARAKVFNYRAALWNGGEKLPTKTKFDGVLVDAPCSGVGTWQRNPHARWTTTATDVHELAEIQKNLLNHAASSVKSGGKLIYSVCTLTPAETMKVSEALTKQFPEFKPLSLDNPFKPDEVSAPELLFWPQDFGGNGMFVAAWEKLK